jgi:sporulation protein YlmC with PRC-barrel domain
MKTHYTKLSAGIVLGLCLGAPLQGFAAEGQSGEMKEASASTGKATKGMTRMTAAELGGKAVVNRNGEEIGEVERVVRRNEDGRHFAVISVGGFLGIGDKQVLVPLEELRAEGGKLHSTAASTEAELEGQTAYEADMYRQVEGERTVQIGPREATGGMGSGSTGASRQGYAGAAGEGGGSRVGFGSLDVNRDGYLSKDEAVDAPRLIDNWQSADANDDGRLDRAEFSAFEPKMEEQSGQKEKMPGEAGGRGY